MDEMFMNELIVKYKVATCLYKVATSCNLIRYVDKKVISSSYVDFY